MSIRERVTAPWQILATSDSSKLALSVATLKAESLAWKSGIPELLFPTLFQEIATKELPFLINRF